jgi:hypothetical protein
VTSTEGTLATLGIQTIRILIAGQAEGTVATPDLLPAEMTAGTLDVQTVATDVPTAEADVPIAGTDATIAAIIAAPVGTTEILEIILEIVAGRAVTEITEAAETRGHTPGRRGHSGLLAEAPATIPKQLANIGGPSLIQGPTNQGENTTCSRRCILGWREATIVPPTMTL